MKRLNNTNGSSLILLYYFRLSYITAFKNRHKKKRLTVFDKSLSSLITDMTATFLHGFVKKNCATTKL